MTVKSQANKPNTYGVTLNTSGDQFSISLPSTATDVAAANHLDSNPPSQVIFTTIQDDWANYVDDTSHPLGLLVIDSSITGNINYIGDTDVFAFTPKDHYDSVHIDNHGSDITCTIYSDPTLQNAVQNQDFIPDATYYVAVVGTVTGEYTLLAYGD
ncbi:MAG: hypothetical protein ACOYB1_10505 [Limnohabitans sp.]